MSKSPIGFVRSFPRLIIKPGEQPQYVGGELLADAFGFWTEQGYDDEPEGKDRPADGHPIPKTRQP